MALATVAIFSRPWDAFLLSGRLETEGIQTHVIDPNLVWVDWTLANALSWVKVQVSEADYQAACSVFQEIESGHFEELLEYEFPNIRLRCPACHELAIQSSVPFSGKALLLLCFIAFSVIFPLRKSKRRCSQCNHQWQE